MREAESPSRRPDLQSCFIQSIDLLLEAIDEGRISRDAVTARLEAEDLALLDEKIESSLWYPVAAIPRPFCRCPTRDARLQSNPCYDRSARIAARAIEFDRDQIRPVTLPT